MGSGMQSRFGVVCYHFSRENVTHPFIHPYVFVRPFGEKTPHSFLSPDAKSGQMKIADTTNQYKHCRRKSKTNGKTLPPNKTLANFSDCIFEFFSKYFTYEII
jgi:hypothetical protein